MFSQGSKKIRTMCEKVSNLDFSKNSVRKSTILYYQCDFQQLALEKPEVHFIL